MRAAISELTEDRLDDLARRFYEAASSGAGWEAALGDMARLLGAKTAAIAISDKKQHAATELLIGGEICRDVIALYTERYASMDPASMAVRKLPIGQVNSCHRYIGANFVARSEYYQDFLIPHGGRYSSGALLFDDGGEWGRLGVQTNARQGPIEGRSFDALVRLTPHIQAAVQQYRFTRIAGAAGRKARASGMLEALDQMGCGAVLTNSGGRVISMNRKAKLHLGCSIRLAGDALCAVDREVRKEFHGLISAAAKMGRLEQRECALALPRPEGRPVIARVSPMFDPLCPSKGEPMVLVKLIDLDARRIMAEDCLREAFGLTGAEARLAMALIGGQELNAVAERLGVAIGTARGQIKRIFLKTETKGQPELAALLERLAVVEAA